MSDYITLVNKVARRTGWGSTTTGSFADPGRPWDAFKEFLNEAKDVILDELGIRDSEEEFVFNTIVPYTTGTILGTAGSTSVNGVGTTWTSAMAGRKMSSSGFDGWMRVSAFSSTTLLAFDASIRTSFSLATYSIFEDEYDLDADVRGVLSAWTDEGPLDIDFVSEAKWLDRQYPGYTDEGVPREMAVFRSGTSGRIWQCQLRPAPDDDYVVRYKARVRLGDLSASTDEWEIAPEIENFILGRAVYMALASKVVNDPDLALVTSADLSRKVKDYRERNYDPMPTRRLRRMAPDQVPSRERVSLDPTRFH